MPNLVSNGPYEEGGNDVATGIGIPCFMHIAGSGVTNAGIPLGNQDSSPTPYYDEAQVGSIANQGQGVGAVAGAAGSSQPVAQYALTLSVSGTKSYQGTVYPSSTGLIASLVDVLSNPVIVSEYYNENFLWTSQGNPQSIHSFYKRSNCFQAQTASLAASVSGKISPPYPGAGTVNSSVIVLGNPSGSYYADVVVTAKAVGFAVVEASYAVYDNSLGDNLGYDPASIQPIMKIYALLNVTVLP